MHYYAESSEPGAPRSSPACTPTARAWSCRNCRRDFLSATRHAVLAQFLYNLGYSTGEFGKNHLGDHPDSLPTAHGFQEFWGYLYHLDAMSRSASRISTAARPNRPSCRA